MQCLLVGVVRQASSTCDLVSRAGLQWVGLDSGWHFSRDFPDVCLPWLLLSCAFAMPLPLDLCTASGASSGAREESGDFRSLGLPNGARSVMTAPWARIWCPVLLGRSWLLEQSKARSLLDVRVDKQHHALFLACRLIMFSRLPDMMQLRVVEPNCLHLIRSLPCNRWQVPWMRHHCASLSWAVNCCWHIR